ncbi:MAG: NAD(P)H-hydrate dehydratase [Gemmatimonadetes bacterium]|nr:NAD(P)H-hydrate dehydratase [Gemmatimonadota bacterium]MYB61416.1 NAD(P)H-hydrate dehydratase [Gemmatimonadota bacterium]
MKLCTTLQMRSIDRRTIEDYSLSGYELMERAGCRVAEIAKQLLEGVAGKTVAVVCGKGNNGGDGFVAARYLHLWGASVTCHVLAARPALPVDAKKHLERLEETGLVPDFRPDGPLELPGQPGRPPALIIDALLGTGLKGPPRDPYGAAIAVINLSSSPVLSVDTPSGLAPGCGSPQSRPRAEWTCVRADHTLSIGLMKVDLATYPGRSWCGVLEVADIGFPDRAVEAEALYLSMPERSEMAGLIPVHRPGDHKGSRGKVAVVAGSAGMAGAATLASRAALRGGAGMVMLGAPAGLMYALTARHTEVMLRSLSETAEGSLSLAAESDIDALLSWADVLAIGPGLTRHEETSALIRRVVSNSERPVVIDADGVNAFAGHRDGLSGTAPEVIMTPHVFELSRLTGMAVDDIEADRVAAARQAAGTLQVTLVLKGAASLVASPDGQVSVNSTGNPGMATAGSGDVLTGLIAALLGQGLGAWDAARLGVYLHGLAGDLGAEAMGPHSLVAGDLIDYLPGAFLHTGGGRASP